MRGISASQFVSKMMCFASGILNVTGIKALAGAVCGFVGDQTG